MLGEFLNNLSFLLNIDTAIIPNIITLCVTIFILYLSFKAEISGISSVVVLIALYTISMGILSLLGINSIFNIFDLAGGKI
jgi:hypothetical protein